MAVYTDVGAHIMELYRQRVRGHSRVGQTVLRRVKQTPSSGNSGWQGCVPSATSYIAWPETMNFQMN
jgi:hypothetical protein